MTLHSNLEYIIQDLNNSIIDYKLMICLIMFNFNILFIKKN